MERDTFLKELQHLPYFSIDSYLQLSGIDNRSTAAMQMSRWEKRGHIVRIKRGLYMTAAFRLRHVSEEGFLPMVSAIIQPLSYTSTHFELQAHGVLTDVTHPITAITIKATSEISNALGDFLYHHIKSDLYRGFAAFDYHGVPTYRATLAKALFDYLYLRPLPREIRRKSDLAEELRLNLDIFSTEERERFSQQVAESDSTKMRDVLRVFQETIWRH